MELFTKKGIKRKIIIVLVIMLLFQFTMPVISSASGDGFGGLLFEPIQFLTLAIGDTGAAIVNLCVTSNLEQPVITLKRESTSTFVSAVSFLWKVSNLPFTISNTIASTVIAHFTADDFEEEIELPILSVTPDKIFSNKIPLLDVNIISPNYTDESGNNVETASSVLHDTIASWYVLLRDVAIVAFLSILVYVGIRIIISSTSSDKAKYQQLLMDWIVGLCLLFLMHYIMSFALLMTEKLTDFVEIDNKGVVISDNDLDLNNFKGITKDQEEIVKTYNENGVGMLSWKTDYAGYMRFYAQTNIQSISTLEQFGYTIMYLVLVIYTFIFVFQYLRRLFNITFLTLISPVVALAYPLDKISDGKAQAFNMWLKEYIFNLILQPVHLILYTVLLGSAMDLATEHPIYAIVVLGFLLQAEKLIRKMFGFDKAQTAATTGAFTGAMVMQGVNAVVKKIGNGSSKGAGKKIGGDSGSGGDSDDARLRLAANRTSNNDFSEEDDYTNRILGASINESENDDSSNNINTESDGSNDNDDTYQQYLDDISNSENNLPDNGQPLEDPALEDPNYMYLHPDEYDSEGNYVGRNGNVTDNSNIVQVEQPQQETEDMEQRPRRKIRDSTAYRYGTAALRYYGPKAAMKLAKTSAKVVGAGTLGMVGMAAGLASDDYKNVATYGAAAMAGGAYVGKSVANRVENMPNMIESGIQNVRDNVAREVYKNDPKGYKKYLNDKSDKEFLANKQIKQLYAEAFGEDKAKEMMNHAIKYREHGVTDNKLIIKAMKQNAPSLGTDVADDRRIVAAKLASNISNEKDMESMTKRLHERGISDKTIKEQEKIIRNIKGFI